MLNDKLDIQIRRYKLTVQMEGLTELEASALAQAVSDKMDEIERDSKVVDTYKLALLAALDFAAEINRLKSQLETQRLVDERKLDELTVTLQNALEPR